MTAWRGLTKLIHWTNNSGEECNPSPSTSGRRCCGTLPLEPHRDGREGQTAPLGLATTAVGTVCANYSELLYWTKDTNTSVHVHTRPSRPIVTERANWSLSAESVTADWTRVKCCKTAHERWGSVLRNDRQMTAEGPDCTGQTYNHSTKFDKLWAASQSILNR